MSSSSAAPKRLDHGSYTVAWISPLEVEQLAAFEMLDEEHLSLPQSSRDHNVYKLGRIANHNIVIAPLHNPGTCPAATVVAQMRMTFPNLMYGLLVGIGGGVPCKTSSGWIRLGHVVVGRPNRHHSGVVQYDYGKAHSGKFERIGALAPPPVALLNAAQALAIHRDRASVDPVWQDTKRIPVARRRLRRFAHPGAENDRLYWPDYLHRQPGKTCAECGCDDSQRVQIPQEGDDDLGDSNPSVVVHRGIIASGNLVVKDARLRDDLAEQYNVLCFEMEAAGALDDFPCMVIRGISDYCDTHKNDDWQPYAATTAAAYARQLLFYIPFAHFNSKPHDIIITPLTPEPEAPLPELNQRGSDPCLDREFEVGKAPVPAYEGGQNGQNPAPEPMSAEETEIPAELGQYLGVDEILPARTGQWRLLFDGEQYVDAERVAREILHVIEEHYGNHHVLTQDCWFHVALTLHKLANFGEAARLFDRVAGALGHLLGESHKETVRAVFWQGEALAADGDDETAEKVFQRISGSAPNGHALCAKKKRGLALMNLGRFGEAQSEFWEFLLAPKESDDELKAKEPEAFYWLGEALLQQQNYTDAERAFRCLIEDSKEVSRPNPVTRLKAMTKLGALLVDLGRHDETLGLLELSVIGLRQHFGRENIHTNYALYQLGRAWHGQGNYVNAETAFKEAATVWAALKDQPYERTLSALHGLSLSLANQG